MTQQTHKISPALIHHFRIEPEAVANWQSLDNNERAEYYEETHEDTVSEFGEKANKNEILAEAVERAYADTQEGKDADRGRVVKLQAEKDKKESDRKNQVVECGECKKAVKRGACISTQKTVICFHCVEKQHKAAGLPDSMIRFIERECRAYL